MLPQAQELSKASQLHAEAAARDLLAAKKAEMQVLPLLTGGKNPDPGAAELLKAQAAAKCAEQLKVWPLTAVLKGSGCRLYMQSMHRGTP